MGKQSTIHANQRSNQNRSGEGNDHHGRLREGDNMMARGVRGMDGLVAEREGQALLLALAAGFGVGCLIGCALASDSSSTSRIADRFAAEGLGRRMLENLEKILPDALSAQFHR